MTKVIVSEDEEVAQVGEVEEAEIEIVVIVEIAIVHAKEDPLEASAVEIEKIDTAVGHLAEEAESLEITAADLLAEEEVDHMKEAQEVVPVLVPVTVALEEEISALQAVVINHGNYHR